MSGDRRIQIIGNIPLPASLAEAGRLQVKVGEAVDVFAAELRKLGIPGEMECKVVSARPKKAAASNGATIAQPAEQIESQPMTDEQAAAAKAAAEQQPAARTTPPWAKQ